MKAINFFTVITLLTCLSLTSQVTTTTQDVEVKQDVEVNKDFELKYELLFEVDLDIGPQQVIGKVLDGKRAIVQITGNTFEGPKLKGKIISGADWMLGYNTTTTKLDIRILMETDDGESIYLKSTGFFHQNEDGTYYLRTVPFFETGAEKYQWLNHIVSVGIGKFKKGGGVQFRIYEIK